MQRRIRTLKTAGLTSQCWMEVGKTLQNKITNSAQTSGDNGDALQFFVDTSDSENGDTITVEVAGLRTFTFTAPPATFQDNPLEGSN